MKEIFTFSDLRAIIYRRTPAIVFFNDPSDDINQKIVKNMTETCKLFQCVLSYKVDWIMMHLHTQTQSSFNTHFVYKFKNRKIDMIASGNSSTEIYQLFNYTFQELIKDFRFGLCKLLKIERNLEKDEICKMIANKIDLNFDRTKPIFTKPPQVYRKIKILPINIKSALEYIKMYDRVPYTKPSLNQRKKWSAYIYGQNSLISHENKVDDFIMPKPETKIHSHILKAPQQLCPNKLHNGSYFCKINGKEYFEGNSNTEQ